QEIRRIPDIRERFPCIDKIITTGSIGFLKKLIREGMIDKGYISGVVDDLISRKRWIPNGLILTLNDL
ncbi:MAG: hypothetical protein NT131_08770, partial [Methanomassiliicoccales archaeon]|nr:hypothetical protein [Methanomassiliicoccales archaeon]